MGYMMIIYIAGIQNIPEDVMEAARIDGAGEFRTFNTIILSNSLTSGPISFSLSSKYILPFK